MMYDDTVVVGVGLSIVTSLHTTDIALHWFFCSYRCSGYVHTHYISLVAHILHITDITRSFCRCCHVWVLYLSLKRLHFQTLWLEGSPYLATFSSPSTWEDLFPIFSHLWWQQEIVDSGVAFDYFPSFLRETSRSDIWKFLQASLEEEQNVTRTDTTFLIKTFSARGKDQNAKSGEKNKPLKHSAIFTLAWSNCCPLW